MAQLADMNIKIGADVADAVDKINQLKRANIQLAEETSALSTEYKKNAKELRELEAALKTGLGVTSQTAGRVGFLKEQQQQLTHAIVDNKAVLKESTIAVKNYDKAAGDAGKATGGLGGSVTKLYGGLRTLANIIPGLGIGGLVAIIAGPLIDAFENWIDSVNKVNKAQELLNLKMAEAVGSTGGEVAQLNALVAIAKDTSLSYAARTQAIKELNKEYPGLHGNITLENINTKAVTDTINREIEAIKRRAEAKAVEKLIDEASVKLEKARLGKADEQGFWQTLPAQVKDATANMGNSISKFLGAPGLFGGTDNAFHQAFVDPIIEATKEIDLLSKKLQEIQTESAKEGTLFIDPHTTTKEKKSITNKVKEAKERVLEGFKDFNIPLENIFKDAKKKINLHNIPFPQLTPEDLKKLIRLDDFEKMAVLVSDKLTPAFDAFFNTIINGSGNAFAAFGNALLKSIEQMIAAIAKAAILAELISLIFPSVGGFSSLFGKFLHFSQGGPVRRFADGGHIQGPGSKTSDSILARLSAGEYVIKADMVNKWGVDFFNKINSGKGFPNINGMLPRFAAGGLVTSNLANLNIGGGQAIQVFGRIEAQGDKLVTIIDRAKLRINRNG